MAKLRDFLSLEQALIHASKDLTDEEWEYYDSQATGFEKDFTWATAGKAKVDLGNLKDSIR